MTTQLVESLGRYVLFVCYNEVENKGEKNWGRNKGRNKTTTSCKLCFNILTDLEGCEVYLASVAQAGFTQSVALIKLRLEA